MTPAHSYEPLIIVFAMGEPNVFTPKYPSGQCQAGICDKRGEYENGKPKLPQFSYPPKQTDRTGHETKRNGPRVTHKHAGRRKVEAQKACRRGRYAEACQGQSAVSAAPGRSTIDRETEDSHPARKSIGAIHKIVKVGEPSDPQHERENP